MVPKVEGPWDIHYVDRLLAQLEAKAGLERPLLVHAILETSLGVVNLEEIATASPRMQGMSFGPADLAAFRRMKTTRVGGGHPAYRVIEDPDPDDPEAPRATAQQDPWHYSIARMVDACTSAGILPFYGPYGDIKDTEGCETQFRAAFLLGCVGAWSLHPVQIEIAKKVFSPPPGRGQVRQEGARGDPRRPRRPHDRRQDAGRRHLEAVQGDGHPRRDAGQARTRSWRRRTSSNGPRRPGLRRRRARRSSASSCPWTSAGSRSPNRARCSFTCGSCSRRSSASTRSSSPSASAEISRPSVSSSSLGAGTSPIGVSTVSPSPSQRRKIHSRTRLFSPKPGPDEAAVVVLAEPVDEEDPRQLLRRRARAPIRSQWPK